MARVQTELLAKDATVSSISRYFEALVADLTDKSHRDPKTKLMNFGRFTEQLESFLALEQRGRWCAVGLVDITGFKWYNDALGHAVGDRIIERVAQLLREQVRSDDLHRPGARSGRARKDLHARLGGDEFCFPDSRPRRVSPGATRSASAFAKRSKRYDWTLEDRRLAAQPVRVDVGVVCLWLGRVAERRFIARRLAADPHSARRQADVRSEGRAREPHLPGARPHRKRRASSTLPTPTPPRWKNPKLRCHTVSW